MKTTMTLLIALSMLSIPVAWGASISTSKHNLSKSGTGIYKVDAAGTSQVCLFCHTPHSPIVNLPLWNRYPGQVPPDSYALYSTSRTMKNISSRSGIANESLSLMCLGCHDGSPLGGTSLRVQPLDGNSNVIGADGETGIAAGKGTRIGPDLRNHHPVNFNVTIGGELNNLGDIITTNGNTEMKTKVAMKGMPLFKSSRGDNTLECGSCHGAHDPTNPSFLRASMVGNELCLACHIY